MVGALLLVGKHRTDHVGIAVWLDKSEQGMQCAVGVPKRKDRVVLESLALMNIAVYATIAAVNIRINRWVYHRVVERCVEHCPLVVSTSYLH